MLEACLRKYYLGRVARVPDLTMSSFFLLQFLFSNTALRISSFSRIFIGERVGPSTGPYRTFCVFSKGLLKESLSNTSPCRTFFNPSTGMLETCLRKYCHESVTRQYQTTSYLCNVIKGMCEACVRKYCPERVTRSSIRPYRSSFNPSKGMLEAFLRK